MPLYWPSRPLESEIYRLSWPNEATAKIRRLTFDLTSPITPIDPQTPTCGLSHFLAVRHPASFHTSFAFATANIHSIRRLTGDRPSQGSGRGGRQRRERLKRLHDIPHPQPHHLASHQRRSIVRTSRHEPRRPSPNQSQDAPTAPTTNNSSSHVSPSRTYPDCHL